MHQLRGLRDDAAWINAMNYADPQNILRGEVGKYENVRFFETTNIPTVSSTTTVYRAVMFGERPVAVAISLPIEMRKQTADYEREKGLAWYGIYGSGILYDDNIVVCESA